MFNKFYYVLLLILISFVLLNSQEAYNKYHYKSRISAEDMHNGIFNNQTESEKQWEKEWKQQLKDKADAFKERKGFNGKIYFHNDRASLKLLIVQPLKISPKSPTVPVWKMLKYYQFGCPLVTDSTSAINTANCILDSIIELINVPRNQIRIVNARYSKSESISGWKVYFQQYANGFRVSLSGGYIYFKENGIFYACDSHFYPDIPTNVLPKLSKYQLKNRIKVAYDLADKDKIINDKFYYFRRSGKLSLEYSAYYNKGNIKYVVRINAISGEIISNDKVSTSNDEIPIEKTYDKE